MQWHTTGSLTAQPALGHAVLLAAPVVRALTALEPDIADKVTDKVGDVLDGAKSAASDAAASVGKAADAAADAAKAAGAKIKGATDDVDFDEIVTQTRTIAAELTEKVKQAYRERPGVVIAAAAGAAVLAVAVLRNLGRR